MGDPIRSSWPNKRFFWRRPWRHSIKINKSIEKMIFKDKFLWTLIFIKRHFKRFNVHHWCLTAIWQISNCEPNRIYLYIEVEDTCLHCLKRASCVHKDTQGGCCQYSGRCVRTRVSNFHYFVLKQLKLLLFPDIFRAHFKVGTILANFAGKFTSDIDCQIFFIAIFFLGKF